MTLQIDDSTVARFSRLFQGYERAYGHYFLSGKLGRDGKVEGSGKTIKGVPTLHLYRDHLQGSGPGLGVIPLREDDTVCFGAIDYDERPIDFQNIMARVKLLGLPLVACKSKSKGIHLYAFTAEPVPVDAMRDRLAEWTALLGMAADTEQFPKQSSRASDGDIGNWINLPYFKAGALGSVGIDENCTELTLEEFLRHAEGSLISTEFIHTSAVSLETELFEDGPPCLLLLEKQGGFPPGARNDGMMAVAVYLKLRYPDTWQDKMGEYNYKMGQRTHAELQQIIKTANKKDYHYRCKQQPLKSVCQRRACLQQRYGIKACGRNSDGVEGLEITSVIKYEPEAAAAREDSSWSIEIEGTQVMLSTSEFLSVREFNIKVASHISRVGTSAGQREWNTYVDELMRHSTKVPQAEDAGPVGLFITTVRDFCLRSPRAESWDGLLNGMVYIEDGLVYFRSNDLHTFLKEARTVYIKSPQWVYHALRQLMGCVSIQKHIRGHTVNVWSIAAPKGDVPGPTEPLDFKQSEAF